MRTIRVKCPKCREMLEIDAQTGAVLAHHEEIKAKAGGDFLNERLRALDQEKARREAVVAESRAREKTRAGEFEKLFKKVKEEGASGKPEKPLREIDID